MPELEEITVVVYSSEGLKHVSRDGTSFYSSVMKELTTHASIQQRIMSLTKLLGYHEKYVGIDKTIFALYSTNAGMSLNDLIFHNGGLLKIPLLYNTKVSYYLFKY